MIEAFRLVRERVPDAQLLLAGSMATDDPEGFRVWEETELARGGDRDIYLLSNLHQVGSVQINAFQRLATVMVQKSVREGFGLTVSEALWKGRPVVGGRAGGITLQVSDGFRRLPRRFDVEDVRRSGSSTCSPTRSAPTRWAPRAASTSADHFLGDPGAARLAPAVRGAALTVVVSNRGPYRSARSRAGRSRSGRARGGSPARLRPAARVRRGRPRRRVASPRRSATGTGPRCGPARSTSPGSASRLLDLDPGTYRLAYDLVSNGTLWFLYHGLFDLVRAALLRPSLARGVGGLRGREPGVRRRGRRTWPAPATRWSWSRTCTSPWSRGCSEPSGPTCCWLTSPTPRSAGPTPSGCCPTDVGDRALPRRWRAAPCGFHAARWARALRGVGPGGARRRRGRRPRRSSRRSAPTSTPSPRWSTPNPTRAAAAELDELVGDRALLLRVDRIDPSKNVVRGLRSPTTCCSSVSRGGGNGRCSSPG